MDTTQLDQVRLFMYAYVHYFMHTIGIGTRGAMGAGAPQFRLVPPWFLV